MLHFHNMHYRPLTAGQAHWYSAWLSHLLYMQKVQGFLFFFIVSKKKKTTATATNKNYSVMGTLGGFLGLFVLT